MTLWRVIHFYCEQLIRGGRGLGKGINRTCLPAGFRINCVALVRVPMETDSIHNSPKRKSFCPSLWLHIVKVVPKWNLLKSLLEWWQHPTTVSIKANLQVCLRIHVVAPKRIRSSSPAAGLSLIKQSKNNESLNFVAYTTPQHNVVVRSFRLVDLVLRVTLDFHNFIILYMQGIPYRWSGRGRVPWRRPRMAYKVASWKKFAIGTGGRSLDMQPFPCWVLPEKVPVEVWWPLIF